MFSSRVLYLFCARAIRYCIHSAQKKNDDDGTVMDDNVLQKTCGRAIRDFREGVQVYVEQLVFDQIFC